jgi:hypothetical protein
VTDGTVFKDKTASFSSYFFNHPRRLPSGTGEVITGIVTDTAGVAVIGATVYIPALVQEHYAGKTVLSGFIHPGRS